MSSGISPSRFVSRPWHTALIGVFHVIVTSGIPGNVMVITAYIKWPALRTSPSTLVVVNQSVADLLTCLVITPYAWFNFTAEGSEFIGQQKVLCLLFLFASTIAVVSSTFNIFILSIERFICIVLPYHYYNWVSVESVKKWIIALWTVVILSNCQPLFGWNNFRSGRGCSPSSVYSNNFVTSMFLAPNLALSVLTALANLAICWVAFRLRNKVADLGNSEDNQHTQVTRADLKIMKMFLMVVGAFYATWLPYTAIFLLFYTRPAWMRNGVPELLILFYDLARVLVFANPAINSVIYAFKNKDIREALLKMLRSRNN
ncbi:hypothetical protein CAPTEDRAFT_144126 [Capitella teleta]|uniref:G-protein coupled receptors family 1 profile domain-containing protein n=1 Tax=Capitella teleta TaxID=283909 RepID=R7UJB1_CAPTE|nr:hypothetical protein CAPTEDRAFT_144126 [Capitella teleta]|eukprot:ELU06295.1 hypothetical protein CAPTEDRAFT_144126 [Capitella teleta]